MPDDGLRPQPEQFFDMLQMRRKLHQAVEPLGLSIYEAAILFQVDSGLTDRRHHAKQMAIQESAVSALITGLVKRRLLTKTKDEVDGRRMYLRLTLTGGEAVKALHKAWEEQVTA